MKSAQLLAVLLLCACAATVSADPVIKIKPAEAPFEGSVASRATLTFNVLIEEDGEPVALANAVALEVSIEPYVDEETGVSVAEAADTWNLPIGFDGGQRTLEIAIGGNPPSDPLRASLILDVAGGPVEAGDIPFVVVVRAGFEADGTSIDFCIPPANGRNKGPILGGNQMVEVELFRDFGEIRGIGVIGTPDANLEEIVDSMELIIRRMPDEGDDAWGTEGYGGEDTDELEVSDAEFLALDVEDNGLADYVQTGFTLSAPEILPISPDATLYFALYARRTDVTPAKEIILAWFEITARERGDGGYFWLDDETQLASFAREQSKALNPKPVIFKNGVQLAAGAQATATLEPSGANGYPEDATGLYGLSWDVRLDWVALKKRTAVVEGDTIRIDLTFPGASVQTISASFEVVTPGIEATSFKTLEDLEEEEYDNGETEKDYLDALIAALLAAGMVVGDDKISFPGGFVEPDLTDPNWADIRERLNALRAALKTFKEAERKKDDVDQLDGKEWEIDVVIEVNGVQIRVRIKVGKEGETAKADDKKSNEPTLVIGLGRDGKPATTQPSAPATDGSKADVKITKKGSLGVALGGDGGNGGEGDPDQAAPKGGNGGGAVVEVDSKKDESDNGTPTGIALGGHGGDSNGQGGDGGPAKATAEKDSNAKVGAGPGNGGFSKWPPDGKKEDQPPAPPQSGEGEVNNGDGITDGKKAKVGKISNNGKPGKAVGGIAVGEPGQPAQDTKGGFVPGDPVTGGDGD